MKNFKKLEGFKFGVIQSSLQIMRILEENDISIDEYEAWIRKKATEPPPKRPERAYKTQSVIRKCPECGHNVGLLRVNTDNESMVGGDYKCQWLCPRGLTCRSKKDEMCGWSEFSTKEVDEEINLYRVEIK